MRRAVLVVLLTVLVPWPVQAETTPCVESLPEPCSAEAAVSATLLSCETTTLTCAIQAGCRGTSTFPATPMGAATLSGWQGRFTCEVTGWPTSTRTCPTPTEVMSGRCQRTDARVLTIAYGGCGLVRSTATTNWRASPLDQQVLEGARAVDDVRVCVDGQGSVTYFH